MNVEDRYIGLWVECEPLTKEEELKKLQNSIKDTWEKYIMEEKEILNLIEREKTRDAWRIVQNAIGRANGKESEYYEHIRSLQDIGVFLGVVR